MVTEEEDLVDLYFVATKYNVPVIQLGSYSKSLLAAAAGTCQKCVGSQQGACLVTLYLVRRLLVPCPVQ